MATGRKLRISAEFTGDGFPTADSGDGPLTLATGGIASSKLADSGVTAGSYTNADITVNAKGQITAAANGSGGGGSGGAPTRATLTDGATVEVAYWGSTAPTLVEDLVGTYTITAPADTELVSVVFKGSNSTLSSNTLILNIVDTDGKDMHFTAELIDVSTWGRQDFAALGINPSQDASTSGTITSTLSNMNYPSGFRLILNFM